MSQSNELATLLARIISQTKTEPEALHRAAVGPSKANADCCDPWTSRARPSFLYVMYVMILFALPIGLVSAFDPATANAMCAGISAYLKGLPDALYALFGTGYIGYSAMRQWGKARGSDR